MFQIFDSGDEYRWYEKSINLLKKYSIWKAEDNNLWLAILNMIIAEFAYVMIDEDLELEFLDYLNENNVSSSDLYNLFYNNEFEIPIEVINFYIEENELNGLPLYGLDDIFDNFADYDITGYFSEFLIDYYSNMKSIFVKMLKEEFDGNPTMILLYFYCNTDNLDLAIKCWNEAGEFYELMNYDINGKYMVEEDDDNPVRKGLLYDFVCIDEDCMDSVYSWVANGLNH